MKHALVTGAGGFIGSHLVERLLHDGCSVTALVRYNSRGSFGWLEGVRHPALTVRLGDVTDAHFVRGLFADGVDTVFHLAALIGIPYSYDAPLSYFRTNVEGTLHLAQAARDAGVRRFVHTSTSEVYGTAQYTPIDERHPLQGQSPYSASKIAADKLVESFHCSFGLPVVTVRPFNTYGPRQSLRAVIPTIVAQALAGGAVRLGSLDPVRDLTYAEDTAAGFVAAAAAPDEALGRVFNLGTGAAVSVGELVERIGSLLGRRLEVCVEQARVRPERSEVRVLLSDNRQARDVLGWKPACSLDEGLRRTIDWFRSQGPVARAEVYTV